MSSGKPILPTGRISILPRFVVGFNPTLAGDQTPRGEQRRKACLLAQLKGQASSLQQLLAQEFPNSASAPFDIATMIRNVDTLKALFDRADSTFDAKLRIDAREEAERPASPYYGDKVKYYQLIKRYPQSTAEGVSPAITSMADWVYDRAATKH